MSDALTHRNERPWPNQPMDAMAIIGHTTASTSRIWVRTGMGGAYTLYLYTLPSNEKAFLTRLKRQEQGAMPHLKALSFSVNATSDFTTVLDISALKAKTGYAYAVANDAENRVIIGRDRLHSFKTLPGTNEPFSFGFYSCHMPYKKGLFSNATSLANEEMWGFFNATLERHAQKDLQFIIGGGDQVYCDGVKTLDIWKLLNKEMRREQGALFPTPEAMKSWYRDIYHGYWGFTALRKVFSSYPTYMIWDDHELCDGWGSYDYGSKKSYSAVDRLLPNYKKLNPRKTGLARKDARTLIERMIKAGKDVYAEYQHCHNPPTQPAVYDYAVEPNASTGIYFLDGRGHRDINKKDDPYKIHGKAQVNRFTKWLHAAETKKREFIFVVAAVPMLHLKASVANADGNILTNSAGLTDDLRDSWEWAGHNVERKKIYKELFKAAERGQKVMILSGDVHVAAAFKISSKKGDIYQLTSSAITYNVSRLIGAGLGKVVADDGTTDDGHTFKRLAMYLDSNYSLIKVNPETGGIDFQLYKKQVHKAVDESKSQDPQGERVKHLEEKPFTHSFVKLELTFRQKFKGA